MPVRNGESFVGQALDALLAQTFEEFEILVSDNASTDHTEDIVRSRMARDPRVRYRRNAQDIGAIQNYNALLAQASGAYFMWAASDDLWEPRFLERLVALLRADESKALAFCHFDNITLGGEHIRTYPRISEVAGRGSRIARLTAMLWLPEPAGKANLIYGLMPTPVARDAARIRHYSRNTFGLDCLVVFRVAAAGSLAIAPELLFHKRTADRSAGHASRSAALAARAAPSSVPMGYLWDYFRVAAQLPLSHRERALLHGSLVLRTLSNAVSGVERFLYWRTLAALGRAARIVRGPGAASRDARRD